eukprot:gene842-1049_t
MKLTELNAGGIFFDSKGLTTLSDKIHKNLSDYFQSKSVPFSDGLSILLECDVAILDILSNWTTTRNSAAISRKWLQIGGISSECKDCIKTVMMMDKYIKNLTELKHLFPNSESYFESSAIHAMFIKVQSYEDLRLLYPITGLQKVYKEWTEMKVETTDKQQMYHDTIFVKFYNRILSLLSTLEEGNDDNLKNRDEIIYNLSSIAWQEMSKVNMVSKFFDRLVIYMLAFEKKKSLQVIEKELHKYLMITNQIVERALITSRFHLDQENTVESKLICIKLLSQVLSQFNEILSIVSNRKWRPEIMSQIPPIHEYFITIPKLVLNWFSTFETVDKTKQFYKSHYVEEFINYYSQSLYSYFIRLKDTNSGDIIVQDPFKMALYENNRSFLSIILNNGISNGHEDYAIFMYNLGIQYLKSTKPLDFQQSSFYFESAFQVYLKIGFQRIANNDISRENLGNTLFYGSMALFRAGRHLEAHNFAVESIKVFLRGKSTFTDVLHQSSKRLNQRPFQEIIKNFLLTQINLYTQQNKSTNKIQFIHDVIPFADSSFDFSFKIQLYDMVLLNFSLVTNEENARDFQLIQIDRLLQGIPPTVHPILHSRFLLERAKILRFHNPNRENIESILQDSIDLVKTRDLASDAPFETAVFNELAKVHYWKAITFIEAHQNQCKDIMEQIKNSNSSLNSTNHTAPGKDEKEFEEQYNRASANAIARFIKTTGSGRFRSPVGSESSLVTKELKLSVNLWSNSAQAFSSAEKMIDSIFSTMPSESIGLLTKKVDSVTIFPTTSKWSSLKVCLDGFLHMSSIYELRGNPKEASYYYERGLLIGMIYGSIKVTSEFLVELGELDYNRQNYFDSKINLELAIFLINQYTNNDSCLKKQLLLSNMLLGDLYRKQYMVSKSKQHYNNCLKILKNLDHDDLSINFTNLLNITNDSTPKEARLLKILSSKVSSTSLVKKAVSNSSSSNSTTKKLNSSKNNGKTPTIEEIIDLIIDPNTISNDNQDGIQVKNGLTSYETRIRGKMARLLILQNKFDLAMETIEQLVSDANENSNCNEITKSILEYQLGRVYYLSVPEPNKEIIWSINSLPTTFKIHPSLLMARENFYSAFLKIGRYNITKLTATICKHLCLTTGQLLPYVTAHFLNLSIGIKCRHDMQSIIENQKLEATHNTNINFMYSKENLFSWNGGVELPEKLVDQNFEIKLKEIYSKNLPSDWNTCNIAIEDDVIILSRMTVSKAPLFIRILVPSFDSNGEGNQYDDDEDDDDEMEMEVEMDEDDKHNNSTNESFSQYDDDDDIDGAAVEKDPKMKFTLFDKLRGDLKTIAAENLLNNKENRSKSEEDSTAWYYKRKALEFEIKNILRSIDSMIGHWKGLFLGSFIDIEVKSRFELHRNKLLKKLETDYDVKRKKPINTIVFDCLFICIPFLEDRQLHLGIIEMMGYDKPSNVDPIQNHHPDWFSIKTIAEWFIKEFTKCFESNGKQSRILEFPSTTLGYDQTHKDIIERYHSSKKQPVVFIIDKYLQPFPFESLDPLYVSSVYRLPSFAFQRYLTLNPSTSAFTRAKVQVDPKKTFYMLNPSGDLKDTQKSFSNYINTNFLDWKGITARVPTKVEYKEALEKNDIFFYMGHGSGEQYFRGDKIQLLPRCSVSILMGCRSGQLEEHGEFEPTGIVLDYLLAGSKSVVGNLFDVPTSDCDRLSMAFSNKWFMENKNKLKDSENVDLGLAIAIARKACSWKYLVGGSCICYGIPTYLKP